MEVFKAFCDVCCSFQHMPWFRAAVLAHPEACVASFLPLHVIFMPSCLLVLNMWRRAGAVIKLQCRKGKTKNQKPKQNKTMQDSAKVKKRKKKLIPLDGTGGFAEKDLKKTPRLATDFMVLLPLAVYVSGLFRICWWTCKRGMLTKVAVHVNTLSGISS